MSLLRTICCRLSDDVAQQPGLLWRVAHMFAERAINIDEIVVHRGDSKRVNTVMVVCFAANNQQFRQILRRLRRFEGIIELEPRNTTRLSVNCY